MKKDLEKLLALMTGEWRPVNITQLQPVLLGLVGNNGILRDDLIQGLEQDWQNSAKHRGSDRGPNTKTSGRLERLANLYF
jgi:hypothetical protein